MKVLKWKDQMTLKWRSLLLTLVWTRKELSMEVVDIDIPNHEYKVFIDSKFIRHRLLIYLKLGITFNLITNFNVIIIFNTNSTFCSRFYFVDRVFESL